MAALTGVIALLSCTSVPKAVAETAVAPRGIFPKCLVLLYAGGFGRHHRTVSDMVDLFSVVDSVGNPTAWLCTGAIVLDLKAVSGRSYYPLPNQRLSSGQDWNGFVDSMMAPRGILPTLDSAIGAIVQRVGPAPGGFKVVVMVPYPGPTDTVWVDGSQYALDRPNGRLQAVVGYTHEVDSRYKADSLSRLSLIGYYWLSEEVRAPDSVLVKQIADSIHAQGREFFWMPYFNAPGNVIWRHFGFDRAWLQPNYFFHPDFSVGRMDTAVARTRAWGMGLGVEFDGRMFDDTTFRGRLIPYLNALESAPDIRSQPIVIYEGAGALIRLARASDAEHRKLYQRLTRLVRADTGS